MIHIASFFYLCFLLLNGVFGDTEVKSVSVTEGDSVTLHTGVKVQQDDHILWMFGPKETRIAEIHRQIIYIYATNTIFEKRLQMDSQTGSLTIRNSRTEHSGLYKLQIISNRGTSYKRFSVSVYALDGRSHLMMVIAVTLALLVIIAVVVGLIYHKKCKQPEKEVQSQDEEIHYADPTFGAHVFQSTDILAADHTEYSSIRI